MEIDAIRARHVPQVETHDGSFARYTRQVCVDDDKTWPCDTAIVLAALDAEPAFWLNKMLEAGEVRDDAIEREAKLRAALTAAADDVRYAGGNGLSDYWRGFNEGIDALDDAIAALAHVGSEGTDG